MKNFFKLLIDALMGGIVFVCFGVSHEFWNSNSYVWSSIFGIGGFLLMDIKARYAYIHKVPPFNDEII